MKRVFLLMSVLLIGVAISANAQDNKSRATQSPRETHNVSIRPQSPRETHKVNSNIEANSRRPSIAPRQENNGRQSSTRTSSDNNNDRVQRDVTKNSQFEFRKPRN